jgi:hypothetical protein
MKKYLVRLTGAERAELEKIASKGKAAANKIKHANILLNADVDGPAMTDEQIARTFRCHKNTVGNVRQCFVENGIEATLNRKIRETPPVERMLDGEKEARLIAIACSEPPEGRASWSLRLLADKLVELQIVDSISHETVRRTLKKKRTETASAAVLGDSARMQRRVRGRNGRRSGSIPASV